MHQTTDTAEMTENYTLSKRHKTAELSSESYAALLTYFHQKYPIWRVHSRYSIDVFPDSLPLTSTVVFFEYVELRGQRFHAQNFSGNSTTSNIDVHVPWSSRTHCGELLEIFQFQQSVSLPPIWLARVKWFKPWEGQHEAVWDL